MLINKTEEAVEVQYDQKVICVEPGKTLDVREFGVNNDAILVVERHVILKNPDVFDQKKTKDILATNKAHVEKIAVLEEKVKELSGKIGNAEKGCTDAQDKMKKVLTDNEGLQNKNKSLTKEVGELKAKLKAAL